MTGPLILPLWRRLPNRAVSFSALSYSTSVSRLPFNAFSFFSIHRPPASKNPLYNAHRKISTGGKDVINFVPPPGTNPGNPSKNTYLTKLFDIRQVTDAKDEAVNELLVPFSGELPHFRGLGVPAEEVLTSVQYFFERSCAVKEFPLAHVAIEKKTGRPAAFAFSELIFRDPKNDPVKLPPPALSEGCVHVAKMIEETRNIAFALYPNEKTFLNKKYGYVAKPYRGLQLMEAMAMYNTDFDEFLKRGINIITSHCINRSMSRTLLSIGFNIVGVGSPPRGMDGQPVNLEHGAPVLVTIDMRTGADPLPVWRKAGLV